MRGRKNKGDALIEAMVCFAVFVPLALLGMNIAVLIHAAQLNEEFAEQLARLCATLPDKTNAIKACQDVIKQYRAPSNVSDVELRKLEFDLGKQEVALITSMNVLLPVPLLGYSHQLVSANVKQPIVSQPAPP